MQPVVRTLRILFELAGINEPIDIATLAKRVDLPRPTVYRHIETLVSEGLVARIDSKIMVTPKLSLLMTGVKFNIGLMDIIRPYLNSLVEASGETAGAHARSGLIRRCFAEVEGTNGVRWARGVGFTAPVWTGAVGHVLLGLLPITEIDSILAKASIDPSASGSITDRSELKQLALEAHERGWSSSVNETVEGACAIAAPLLASNGEAYGAISLYAPSSRYDALLGYTDLLRKTSSEIADEWAKISQVDGLD